MEKVGELDTEEVAMGHCVLPLFSAHTLLSLSGGCLPVL